MAMSVQIRLLNGGSTGSPNNGGTISGSSFTWCRDDTLTGTTAIPTPSAGPATNFSWVKTLQAYIVLRNSLSMTNLTVGRLSSYALAGAVIWYVTSHNQAAYAVATSPPASTVTNNATAPTINLSLSAAMPLLGSASPYQSGPVTGDATYVDPLVEVCLGVDATCVGAGSGLPVATLRWTWVEG